MNFRMRDFLSSFRFNTKLLMLIIPPTIVILYLTLNSAMNVYAKYKSFSDVKESMVATTKISALIHEVQIERGISAAYISSKGILFKEELPLQQKRVDKISKIKDINKMRMRVKNLKVSAEEQIDYYSHLISIYLQQISTIVKKSNDAWMTRELIVYETFLLYKENTGIERAVGSNIFTKKTFDLKLYRKFDSTLAHQEACLKLFKMYADKEAVTFFEKMTEKNSFQETLRMENIILASDNSTLFNENPSYWFSTLTKKINILKKSAKNVDNLYYAMYNISHKVV